MSKDRSNGLDVDTRRLVHLAIDDILFGEADKWVDRIEDAIFEPQPEARTIFPESKNKSFADELFTALTTYKEERMRYSDVMQDYRVRLRDFEEYLKQYPQQPSESESGDASEWFVRMERDIPKLNYEAGVEYLAETRERKILAARNLLAWVDKAILAAVLKPGASLPRKLSECDNARIELDNDFQELRGEYTLLLADYSQLEQQYNLLYYQSHVRNPT